MKLYNKLDMIDPIGPVVDKLEPNGFMLDLDGRIRPAGPRRHSLDTPWLNTKVDSRRHCFKWHRIYFNFYGLIPSGCMNCFKLVVRPRTLKELFVLRDLQAKQVQDPDFVACKCGIERRANVKVKALYGGYYYMPLEATMAERKSLARKIKLEVRGELGIQYTPFLKRGCTEMEAGAGSSESWEYDEKDRMFEDILESTWVIPKIPLPEPTVLRPSIMKRWILWAAENSDPTAKDYIDLEMLTGPPPMKYLDEEVELKSLPELGPMIDEEEWKDATLGIGVRAEEVQGSIIQGL